MPRGVTKKSKVAQPLMVLDSNSGVKAWGNTRDLIADIHRVIKAFDCGDIDSEQARVYVGSFRNVAHIVAMELEHARLTGRLKVGDDRVTGIKLI